jgi:uncharacterized membrane protein YhdT
MNSTPPRPQHRSYQAHRRQIAWQIILPVALAAVAMIVAFVVITVGAARGTSDLGKWADVSTIWLAIPVGIGALIILGVLSAVVYLLGRILGVIPRYTVIGQKYAWGLSAGAKEADRVSRNPRLAIPWIQKAMQWNREKRRASRQRAAHTDAQKG